MKKYQFNPDDNKPTPPPTPPQKPTENPSKPNPIPSSSDQGGLHVRTGQTTIPNSSDSGGERHKEMK